MGSADDSSSRAKAQTRLSTTSRYERDVLVVRARRGRGATTATSSKSSLRFAVSLKPCIRSRCTACVRPPVPIPLPYGTKDPTSSTARLFSLGSMRTSSTCLPRERRLHHGRGHPSTPYAARAQAVPALARLHLLLVQMGSLGQGAVDRDASLDIYRRRRAAGTRAALAWLSLTSNLPGLW